MNVLLKLLVICCVTFVFGDVPRFGESTWQNPVETNYEDPILAYITRVNSNLQPMFAPFLGYIYNNYNAPKQPAFAYPSGVAHQRRAKNFFKRRNENEAEKEIIYHCDYEKCPRDTHSCESTAEKVSENTVVFRITTSCLSVTNEALITRVFSSSNHTGGIFTYETLDKPKLDDEINTKKMMIKPNETITKRGNDDAIEKETIFRCDQLTCPSETHRCKSTFIAVPEEFIEMKVTTQCLSITNEVLDEQSTNHKNPLSEYFYFEFDVVEDEYIDK
ncbi:unnamed protein product [Diamesa serratosioi]